MGDLSVDPVTFWERLSKLHKTWNVRPAARANVKETRAGLKGWEWVGEPGCRDGDVPPRHSGSAQPKAKRRQTREVHPLALVCEHGVHLRLLRGDTRSANHIEIMCRYTELGLRGSNGTLQCVSRASVSFLG